MHTFSDVVSFTMAMAMAMAACCTSGCTIYQQTETNKQIKAHNEVLQTQVEQQQQLQVTLNDQMQQLSDELATKQLSAKQLDQRLAALQQENDRLARSNSQKKTKTDTARRELADLRAELQRLQNEKNLTDQQMRDQIAALQAKVRERLLILAQVK
jgi:membrane-bound lytic murein transglycosylase B